MQIQLAWLVGGFRPRMSNFPWKSGQEKVQQPLSSSWWTSDGGGKVFNLLRYVHVHKRDRSLEACDQCFEYWLNPGDSRLVLAPPTGHGRRTDPCTRTLHVQCLWMYCILYEYLRTQRGEGLSERATAMKSPASAPACFNNTSVQYVYKCIQYSTCRHHRPEEEVAILLTYFLLWSAQWDYLKSPNMWNEEQSMVPCSAHGVSKKYILNGIRV